MAILVFALLGLLLKREENPLAQRLAPPKPSSEQKIEAQAPAAESAGPISATMQKISRAASGPMMPKERSEQGKLRVKLAHAGVYSPNAIPVFVGFKLILLIAGFVGGGVVGEHVPDQHK